VKYAVAFGDSFSGHTFYGPFDEKLDAVDWGGINVEGGENWWIIELEEPNA